MSQIYSDSVVIAPQGSRPSADMTSQIFIRDYPHRAVAIASGSHTLILRHSPATSEASSNGSLASSGRQRSGSSGSVSSKCMVEFTPTSKRLLEDYRPLTPRPIYGTLGLISTGRDVFLCVITQASRAATLRPGETVQRIEAVEFFCLNSAEYDDVPTDPYDLDSDIAVHTGQGFGRRDGLDHPCQELQKLLGNGTFYYSTDFDVTNRMQDRPVDATEFDLDNFDESFLWNSFMIRPLIQFRSRLQRHEREVLDASRILTCAIRGFCKTIPIPQAMAPLSTSRSGLPSYLTVISRLSCKRAGTRFNSRGIDDDGNVANFVETETIYWSPSGVVFSYVQVRGSVPVFWEQSAGLLPGQQKITITRSPDGTQPAFDKHFYGLEQAYGAVHVINLLSATKPWELELTELYRLGIRNCPLSHPGGNKSKDHALLRDTEYDFHAETKGPQGYVAANEIRRYIEDSADGFAYYLAEESDEAQPDCQGERRYVVILQQEGVFRTNCLDCLDRTNLIQTIISQMAVESFLGHRGEHALSDFWSRHGSLWADNGDALSKIYAGTGALKSSFTRTGKMSLAGAIADVRKSATRLYINNFADKARQNTIDTLLGRLVGQSPVIVYDPISDYVAGELQRRSHEFSSNQKIHIFIGTFNLNGRTEGIDEDLSPWLCPPELRGIQPEIIAIGFQEIVELNPQQIMNSDPTRKQAWERAIKRTLDKHYKLEGDDKYVLLRSGQLVGAALCIFVKASVLPHIKNVEGSVKKTGLSGMAGNKGAVAIRLDYANTPICFVTAHLAAGFANYDERNRDYATIDQGLWFQRNRGIRDHESVIWFGDFNYRIGLDLETTKNLVKKKNLESLFANDQLNLQMIAGLAFQYYSEARINFLPTYKYDIGTDNFDTSEKARIPAWTDRILRKGSNLRQLVYNSAPLRFSDHRPVYGLFECTVNIVNEKVRDKISREIYERRKAEVGRDTPNLLDDWEDEDLIGYEAIEPGLPAASSDRQKWWLEGGKMARSGISPPKPESPAHQTILNPKRQANPYVLSDEPDWVSIPRSESRMSSFSSMSTSPFENITHSMLSSSASSSGPRKLPPPYNPSTLPAKVGRMQIVDEAKASQTEGPPPPPPRRTTTNANFGAATIASASSPSESSKRKPVPSKDTTPVASGTGTPAVASPPPIAAKPANLKSKPAVARKPAHLAAPTSPASSTSTIGPADTAVQAPQPPPRHSISSFGNVGFDSTLTLLDSDPTFDNPPPKPPRRTNTGASVASMPPSIGNKPAIAVTSITQSHRVIPPAGALPGAGGIPPAIGAAIAAAAQERRLALPQRKPTTGTSGFMAGVGAGNNANAEAGTPGEFGSNINLSSQKQAPPPPPRRTTNLDLLGDDDDAGSMSGWEALKPMR